MDATPLSGGSVKIVDSTNFPVSTEIAVAEVTVEPGAMRELHVSINFITEVTTTENLYADAKFFQWHPTQDEWGFFL